MPKSAVITTPESKDNIKQGFDQLADLLALTLGPSGGGNVLTQTELNKLEVLSDAATIVRRITALPDRRQDVGAMLLRNLVWRVHQQVGDGGATAAILAQAILDRANFYVAAGSNAMLIQRGVKLAVDVALNELKKRAQPVKSEDDLTSVAYAVTGEDALSLILGEMFDLLGAQAHITVEEYTSAYLERIYIDGGKWEAEVVSPYFITTTAPKSAVLHDCAVALYDGEILEIDEVMPLLELVSKRTPAHLLLFVKDVTDEAFNLLVTNHQRGEMKLIVARCKRYGAEIINDFNDLALLTGAHYFSKEMRVSLRGITEEHLGRARRVEVQERTMFVVGGGGASSAVRAKIDEMNQQLQNLLGTDEGRPEFIMRIARLSGTAAVLQVGAISETARTHLKQQAEKGIKALRATVEEGVLPGGGIAYINCIPALKKIAAEGDEALGVKAVMFALEAPFRKILGNAGIKAPGVVLEELKRKGLNYVYDVRQRKVVDSALANVLDPAKVLRSALQIAASGASIAMTTETIVLKKNPEISYEP